MLSTKRKLQLLASVTSLLTLALALGCNGFFVDPTLTSLAVGPPTPAIQQSKNLQMIATGSYDDGSTKTLTGDVLWGSDKDTIATVSSGGLVAGVSPGAALITASSGTVSGSTTVTITLSNLNRIDVTPATTSVNGGNSVTYKADGFTSGGGPFDITDTVNWTASDSHVTFVNNVANTTAVTANTTVIITATDPSTNIKGTASLTLTP